MGLEVPSLQRPADRDYYSCITLCDPTASLIGSGLICLFFEANAKDLPAPVNTGEVLIVYDIRIKPHKMDIQAWSTHQTRFKLIGPGYDARTLRADEFQKAEELRKWWAARGGAPGARGDAVRRDNSGAVVNEDGPSRSKKLKPICEVQIGGFYDIVCEVPHTLLWSG